MAVTLSYFVEPHETRRTQYAGAWLQWDLQRQLESEADFLARINDRDRDPHAPPDEVDAWPWEIGVNPRRRGSIQSDRLTVDAAALAGERLISVFPVGGWWRDHLRRRAGRPMRYSVVVTVDAGQADVDLYSLIQIRLPVDVPADVLVDVPIDGVVAGVTGYGACTARIPAACEPTRVSIPQQRPRSWRRRRVRGYRDRRQTNLNRERRRPRDYLLEEREIRRARRGCGGSIACVSI